MVSVVFPWLMVIQAVYFAFIVFIFPQAVAEDFSTIVIARVVAGGCAGALQNITGGIISDLWRPGKVQDFQKALYIWALLAGASTGSLFGGLIMKYSSWQW
jgi:predicted MFS family arabinose efflux permease